MVQSSSRCLAFILCFLLVNCYHDKLIQRRQSKSNSEVVENYEFVSCMDKTFSQSYKNHSMALKCKPRETVVQIHSRENDVEVNQLISSLFTNSNVPSSLQMMPSHVVVKRCYESGCQGMKSCIPTKKGNVTVPVQLINHIHKTHTCTWFNVVEHLECKCRCGKSRQHCERSGKRFNASACACECMNLHEKPTCEKQENMFWDEDTCSCMCKITYRECSTGSTWAPQHCKCVPYSH